MCIYAGAYSVSLQSDIYWPGCIIQRLYNKTSCQTYLEPDSLDDIKRLFIKRLTAHPPKTN